jgi:hypothetical protein
MVPARSVRRLILLLANAFVGSKTSCGFAVCFAVVIGETVLSTMPVAQVQILRRLHLFAVVNEPVTWPELAFLLLRQKPATA